MDNYDINWKPIDSSAGKSVYDLNVVDKTTRKTLYKYVLILYTWDSRDLQFFEYNALLKFKKNTVSRFKNKLDRNSSFNFMDVIRKQGASAVSSHIRRKKILDLLKSAEI